MTMLAPVAHGTFPRVDLWVDSTPGGLGVGEPDPVGVVVAELRRLAGLGAVPRARELLAEAIRSGLSGPAIETWRKILEPPRGWVLTDRPPSSPSRLGEWLEAHGAEYAGQWVAVRRGELVDSDPAFQPLWDRVRLTDRDGLVLHRVPA